MSAPAYVVNSDFEGYAAPWTTDNPEALTLLLERAEHYINLLASTRPIIVPATDTVHRVSANGIVSGGTFTLSLVLGGITYTTADLPYDATGSAIASALRTAGVDSIAAIGGPLPFAPVYLIYRGTRASLPVPQGSSVSTNITGGGAVDFKLSALGGAMGQRFNPGSLDVASLVALKNAVCAQADYMLQMDDKLFDQAQYSSVKGPAFTTQGKLPVVSPKARRELGLAGFRVGIGRATR